MQCKTYKFNQNVCTEFNEDNISSRYDKVIIYINDITDEKNIIFIKKNDRLPLKLLPL